VAQGSVLDSFGRFRPLPTSGAAAVFTGVERVAVLPPHPLSQPMATDPPGIAQCASRRASLSLRLSRVAPRFIPCMCSSKTPG